MVTDSKNHSTKALLRSLQTQWSSRSSTDVALAGCVSQLNSQGMLNGEAMLTVEHR